MAKRRGQGEGSIYQRADGKWVGAITLGYKDGRQQRKVVYGATQKEVIDKLRKLQAQHLQGIDIAPERITVTEFLDQWLEQIVKTTCRPTTYRSYSDVVRRYLTPHVGQWQLAKLTPAHVQTMVNTLAGTTLTARTVDYIRSVLSRALNRAVRWGYIPRNVASVVQAPRGKSRSIEPLTTEQARVLLTAAKGHRLEVMYRIALSLGLRKGEIVGLRWVDIDLKAKTLRVTGIVHRVNGKVERSEPKTAAGARTLALSPKLVTILQRHKEAQDEERVLRGEEWKEHDLVFPSEVGTPLEHGNLHRQFKRMLEKAGLPSTTRFHDLRHSCAAFLIANGEHPRVVMQYLGHSKISVTMDVYGHVFEETQREAGERVDGLLDEEDEDEE